MATFSASGRVADTRSGGKIVPKRRRRPIAPYDRPPAPDQPQPKSPNWFTSVIFPVTCRIASGAVKILSSVFDSDNSDDSSSSLSSSDSEAAHGDNNYDELDNLYGSAKDHGALSEAANCISEVRQLSAQKSETKHTIEKLLMQESYSREECDRLVQIINSRIVGSNVRGMDAGVPIGTLHRTIQNDTDDVCGKAIMEARKWLKEKKVGSSPLSDGADVSCGLKSVAVQYIDNEAGSPVDIAKVYMTSRPPWASPSADHIELRTPSTMTSQLSGEGTLFPLGDESLSSFKKRISLASGSWNIQEEIRRVRLKATEDLLQSPSKTIDSTSFALSPSYGQDYLVAKLLNISEGDKGKDSTSLIEAKPINLSVNNSAIGSSNAMEMGNGLANEGVMSKPPTRSLEQYQDSQAIKIGGECAVSKSSHPANPDLVIEQHDDPQSACVNGSPEAEMRSFNGTRVNGPSQARFLADQGAVDIHTQIQEENLDAVKGQEKEKTTTNMEEKCELLSEISIEVPIMHETNCLASFSQSNSSLCHNDELPWTLTQPNPSKLAGKPDAMVLKQEGKQKGRYNRRGRERGRS